MAVSVQDQIWSWVPGVVDQPVSSRHFPDSGLSRAPSLCGTQTWAPVPLQSYRSTVVPLAVPAAFTSRHLPRAWRVFPEATVHCWAFVPLHVYTCTGVKLAALAPRTSTHRPP